MDVNNNTKCKGHLSLQPDFSILLPITSKNLLVLTDVNDPCKLLTVGNNVVESTCN